MRQNIEFPTEWVIVSREDEPQQEQRQNQNQTPGPPAGPQVEEEDSQVLQAYIVAAA